MSVEPGPMELRDLVDQAYESVNSYVTYSYDLINAALANRRVWVQVPNGVYYLATCRRGFTYMPGEEDEFRTHVELEYANPDESTMVSNTENFRTSSIIIQNSQIVDFNNFLEAERGRRAAVIVLRAFQYDGAYLIGHFHPDNALLVVLLNDPETGHPLITRAEWGMLQEYLHKETVARERFLVYNVFGRENDHAMYNEQVFPAYEEERLARNQIFEHFLHESIRQDAPGRIARFQLCHGVLESTTRSPFMDTHAAHCPFVVVKAKDDDILFERENHWVVYPEDAPEAPVETEPSMEIEPEGIPE